MCTHTLFGVLSCVHACGNLKTVVWDLAMTVRASIVDTGCMGYITIKCMQKLRVVCTTHGMNSCMCVEFVYQHVQYVLRKLPKWILDASNKHSVPRKDLLELNSVSTTPQSCGNNYKDENRKSCHVPHTETLIKRQV